MKLPDNIYAVVKDYFGHHGCWHLLRLIADTEHGQEIRNRCFPPDACSPWPHGLKEQGKPGSGDDFLKFHREMLRNFKWIVATAGGPAFDYSPWVTFPGWLSDLFDAMSPGYLKRAFEAIEQTVRNGTSDDLGRLIEVGATDPTQPLSIHSSVHGAVSDYENRTFGPQTSCDMGRFDQSIFNQHFWRFHGWIDDIYARWQYAHGEFVQRWPLQPMAMGKMCPECAAAGGEAPPISSWMQNWQAYLKSRS